MRQLARFAVRRPGPVLLLWAVAFVIALFLASSARNNLHETNLQIPGTESARAAKLTRQEFGGTISMAILLKGPPALVEERGPQIVQELERIDGVQVLSPWAIGGARVLKEPPGQALLTLQVKKPFEQISDETTPAVQKVLSRDVRPPMTSEVTGLAPLVRALNESSLDSLDKGERIALPILFVMLLLIFRSPLAALVPAISGLLVTRIGTAMMGFINHGVEVDALALNMVTMIGLALGVDYSLLIVSRFREELAAGRSVAEAVEEAAARAGKTVVFAGTALSVGMLGALLIAPGALLVSATMGVVVAAVMAVLVALLAMPAGLAVLGTNVNRWQWGRDQRGGNPWVAIAERALRKPGVAAFFVLLPLLVLSSPALALNTGPPNVANLPPDNASRKSYEAFEKDRGAGWSTPFEITFHSKGPITTRERLRRLRTFQDRVRRLEGVDAVLGPAALADRTAVLREITRQIVTGSAQLARLERGLRRVRNGTGALRAGLGSGARGAHQLENGLGLAHQGSERIANGTKQAAPQTKRLADGINLIGEGSRKITKSSKRTRRGASKLQTNLEELSRTLTDENRNSDDRLNNPLNRAQSAVQSALRSFGSVSPLAAQDPSVQRARQEVTRALSELGPLKTNLTDYTTELDTNALAAREIFVGTRRLARALAQLSNGSNRLDSGIAKTATGAAQIARAALRLSAGTAALNNGLLTLLEGPGGSGGARSLASGLDRAYGGSNRIGRGVQRLLNAVVRVRTSNDRQREELRSSGTDVNKAASSGYFVLAAIEGAQPQTRTNVSFATNVDSGGNTARVIVVPRKGPFDSQSAGLRKELEHETDATAKQLGSDGIVGGPAVLLDDFDKATTARFPYLVLTLVLVTFLVLLLVFRSPILAFCAVILNLVTVGAAVGVLIICFQTDPPLLGGPGYLDAIALSGIFAIIFGLSIDYEVFLISRLLEGRALTGTTEGAIHYSLEKTATIITGAAFIMAGVFLAFAVSPVTNTRQFGIGLTVAVLLDATLVRLILLPALIRLFGERTWNVPAWLDRILPRFSTH
jgi:putative drug exporter of the RND superfamily